MSIVPFTTFSAGDACPGGTITARIAMGSLSEDGCRTACLGMMASRMFCAQAKKLQEIITMEIPFTASTVRPDRMYWTDETLGVSTMLSADVDDDEYARRDDIDPVPIVPKFHATFVCANDGRPPKIRRSIVFTCLFRTFDLTEETINNTEDEIQKRVVAAYGDTWEVDVDTDTTDVADHTLLEIEIINTAK